MIQDKIYKKVFRKYLKNKAEIKRNQTIRLDQKSERQIQLMAAMFFIGFFLTVGFGYKTLLTWNQIIQLFLALALVFSFIPKQWLPTIYQIRKELKVLLGICALAPLFTGLILMLNFYIGTVDVEQRVKVIKYNFSSADEIILVELDNEILNKHVEIRKFPIQSIVAEPDSAVYIIQTGIFGIKTVKDSWLLSRK